MCLEGYDFASTFLKESTALKFLPQISSVVTTAFLFLREYCLFITIFLFTAWALHFYYCIIGACVITMFLFILLSGDTMQA